MMKTYRISLAIAIFFLCASPPQALAAEGAGTCLVWEEGDAQHLLRCEAASLEKCAQGKKAMAQNETAFADYKGRLYRSADGAQIFEFRNDPPTNCGKELTRAARDVELAMAAQWKAAVYSAHLKAGDKAYIYGKSVTLREAASAKSKALGSLADRAEAKLLERSKQISSIPNLLDAYWFKISVDGNTGWVYGQFLHPDPNSQKSFVGGG